MNSFNSQPPEGGWINQCLPLFSVGSFNSQPPEGGWQCAFLGSYFQKLFQLTAARRRLAALFIQ